MNDSTSAVLEQPAPPEPEPKPDWQCRTVECEKPVFGNLVLCTACSILFGPYDILLAGHAVTEWDPFTEAQPDAEVDPGGDPETPSQS